MEKANSNNKTKTKSYTALQLGVWQLLLPKSPPSSPVSQITSALSEPWANIKQFYTFIPILRCFMVETFRISPFLVLLDTMLQMLGGLDSMFTLWASAKLLKTVEAGIAARKIDAKALLRAILFRLLSVVMTHTCFWARNQTSTLLADRMNVYFEERLLRESLRFDIPTSEDKSTQRPISAHRVHDAFEFFSGFINRLFRLASQLAFISQQSSAGSTFTLLSFVGPVWRTRLAMGLWTKPHLVYSNNVDYLRIKAIRRLVFGDHREDIVAGNLAAWILGQYGEARKNLENIPATAVSFQYRQRVSPLRSILNSLIDDLPMLYLATKATSGSKDVTVSSFALFQSYKESLDPAFHIVFYDISRTLQYVNYVQALYDLETVPNKVVDGCKPYPNSTHSTEKGMSFELRDIFFAYPNTNSKENAIRNVSFKIQAGQLVVIVGDNGSGKSTLIKLLTRLYDVDSGEILIDGEPIKSYCLSDLRKVQALLTQDHKLFPLTLAENIGLGSAENVHDAGMIRQAAEDGGAAELIAKMTDGFETILSPVLTARAQHLDGERHKDLKQFFEGLEKQTEVSGGEKQRLVASRTFMRFLGGGIRFAVADEPSSALDPKAEHRLFQKFRDSREGKTLVFVTHRFGHLVKHADLIIRMKEGQVAELGTHQELMAHGGEYSELYNVQAQAYADRQ